MLPAVLPSAANYGRVTAELMSRRPPICGVAGDQQASLFGHCCFLPGDVKATYGTGCFILMNTGSEPVESKSGLVTTIAATADDSVGYALEGSVFNAGSVVTWLKDEMGLVQNAEETEALAQSLQSTDGVQLCPGFHRPRRALVGSLRSGNHQRVDARVGSSPYRASRPREHCVPGRRRDRRDEKRLRLQCRTACRGRRGFPQRVYHAMAGQYVGMPGGQVGDERGHGPGRRLPGGALCGGLGVIREVAGEAGGWDELHPVFGGAGTYAVPRRMASGARTVPCRQFGRGEGPAILTPSYRGYRAEERVWLPGARG